MTLAEVTPDGVHPVETYVRSPALMASPMALEAWLRG